MEGQVAHRIAFMALPRTVGAASRPPACRPPRIMYCMSTGFFRGGADAARFSKEVDCFDSKTIS